MNPDKKETAKRLIDDYKKIAKNSISASIQTIICPPLIYAEGLIGKGTSLIEFGAQDVSFIAELRSTGEISASQLKNIGIKYVIIGHSERRAIGETNEMVARKLSNTIKVGLTVILCVGEQKRDGAGLYFIDVANQIRESLHDFPESKLNKLIIAYEPVWAVGMNATHNASPRDFEEMAMLIRRTLTEQFSKAKSFAVPILYGGSVDKNNSQSYFDVGADGLLVGRSSLKANEFVSIIEKAINNSKK